jgi:beta-galactosidase GanA
MDVVQHNHYNVASDLYKSLFYYDFARTLKDRPFWVTETQTGWNGSFAAYGGYRASGHNYINSLAPIAKGAEMNLYWLYRSHKAGHELGHGAILSSSGRPNSAGKSTKTLSEHLEKAKDFIEGSKVKSKIALTYSAVSVVNLRYVPTVADLDRNVENRLIENFYDAFRHHNIDVIETEKSLDGYDVVISPMLTNLDDDGFKDRVIEFVKNGGTWIVGPLSDIMTEYAVKYDHAPYSILEDLCGVYTKYQLPIEEKEYTAKLNDGTEFNIFLGCDAYELNGATSLATYENVPDLKGLCAIAQNNVGKGKVIILGTAPDKETLLKLVDKEPIAKASRNVSVVERTGEQNGIIAFEIEDKDGYIVLDKPYYDIINDKEVCGKVEIKPYTALFLKQI